MLTWGLYVWPCVHMGVKGSTWFAHWGWEKGMLEEMFPTTPHVLGISKKNYLCYLCCWNYCVGPKVIGYCLIKVLVVNHLWSGGCWGDICHDLVNMNERKVCMYISNRVWKKNCHPVTSTKRGDICVWNYH
jgi:hypothetical protein